MLYDLKWLAPGKLFPPDCERERIRRYKQNIKIFDNEHWTLENDIYLEASKRIQRIIGNFDSYISFPVLYNYQRLIALKTADLVAGEFPTITYSSDEGNAAIQEIRYDTDFENNLYATVLDLSRFGDAIWRKYKIEGENRNTYCNWMPTEWFPIVSQDGTFTEKAHVLAWPVCVDPEKLKYELHAQVHEKGFYTKYRFAFTLQYFEPDASRPYPYNTSGSMGIIGRMLEKPKRVNTGFKDNAVMHLRPYKVNGTVYGRDDFMVIDSLVVELMTRMAQISNILDKHADPSITGPVSMLSKDEKGELYFKKGKFYAYTPGETPPQYLTWDGQLDSAFKQCEEIINQLYVLSEMGAALLGANDGGSQAVSGNALRLKMVNPLAKVRRISNNLTKPVTILFADISERGYDEVLDRKNISVVWKDGLPNDPREQAELIKLLTGEAKIMPLVKALEQHLNLSHEEALKWVEMLKKVTEPEEPEDENSEDEEVGDKGPGSKTGVNPMKKGSNLTPHKTGSNNSEEGNRS